MAVEQPRTPEQREADLAAAEAHAAELEEEAQAPSHAVDHSASQPAPKAAPKAETTEAKKS